MFCLVHVECFTLVTYHAFAVLVLCLFLMFPQPLFSLSIVHACMNIISPQHCSLSKPLPVVTMPKFILNVLVAIIISDDGYFMTKTIKYFPDMILRESVLLTIHFHGAALTS